MATAIANSAIRQDAIIDVVSQWRKRDAKAAQKWLSEQSLDPETLNRLEN